jgi:hypothetical protein
MKARSDRRALRLIFAALEVLEYEGADETTELRAALRAALVPALPARAALDHCEEDGGGAVLRSIVGDLVDGEPAWLHHLALYAQSYWAARADERERLALVAGVDDDEKGTTS